MRLRIIPDNTSFDFFSRWKLWLGISAVMIVLASLAADPTPLL